MATRVLFRATIFGTDGVTPLVPRAGAPHADSFQVTTQEGVAGWQPYLMRPRGRRTGFDPLTRHTEVGEVTFAVLDAKVGGSNTSRWASAFVGDTANRVPFRGLRVKLERSTDGGSTWNNYFTGKIRRTRSPHPGRAGPQVEYTASEEGVDEYRSIFVGPPHTGID